MANRSGGARVGIAEARLPRLFGYFGRGGETAAAALATIRSMAPGTEIDGATPDTLGEPFTAFGLVANDAPALARARTPDGSFLLLDGYLLEDRRSVRRLLDRWIQVGTPAFAEIRFRGVIVAWNASTSTCSLLRDAEGAAPLFMAEAEDTVVVSSELATLVGFGIDASPNPEAIDAFVTTGQFAAPITPILGIAKLPPGHIVSITAGGASASMPWADHFVPNPVSETDARELIEGRFQQALQRTWPDDGAAGVLLSGGVDSALILAGITKMLKEPARAFTYRYEDYDGDMNEGRAARAVAAFLGVPHEEIPVKPLDVLSDLDAAVKAYGEPFTWSLHTYHLGPIVDSGVTTVFSGSGADSSGLMRKHKAALRYSRLPAFVGGPVGAALKATRPLGWKQQAKAEWVSRRVSGIGELYSQDSNWSRNNRRRLYQDPTLADRGGRQLLAIYDAAVAEHPDATLERTLLILSHRFNSAEQAMLWNRAWPNAFGLRLELPYVDHDFLDLVLNIHGGTTAKELQRELASRYLPKEMAYAPKFPQQMPVNEWLRGSLADPARERLSELPNAMTAIYDPAGLSQLLDDHIAGRGEYGWQIIGLLTTAAWFNQLPR